MIELSIVTSTYNSENTISDFLLRVRDAVGALDSLLSRHVSYEIVIVDDCSTDNTLKLLEREAMSSRELKVLALAQNYGQHRAMLQGMRQALGDRIFILDSDLEDNPSWLLEFWEKIARSGIRSVHGEYVREDGPFWRRKGGELFWRLYNRLTSLDLPISQTMARLMTRDFLDAALASRRRSGLLAQILAAAGASEAVLVEKSFKGSSSYSVRQKLSMAGRQLLISSDEIWWKAAVASVAAGLLSAIVSVYFAVAGSSQNIILVGLTMTAVLVVVSAISATGYMLRGIIANTSESQPVIIRHRIQSS